MPKAIPTSTTPRRSLFRGAAALLATAALPAACQSEAFASLPSPTAGDDAELIRVCRAFTRTTAELKAADAAYGPQDPGHLDETGMSAALNRWYDDMDRIADTTARTPEGIRTKAHAAHAAMASLEDFDIGREEALALSALTDLVGRA